MESKRHSILNTSHWCMASQRRQMSQQLVMPAAKLMPVGHGVSPQLYNDDGSRYGVETYPEVPLRHYIVGALFLCISALFFYYWTLTPLISTRFEYGYPNTNSDVFQSARYGFHWWIVWGLNINAIPLLFLAFALLNNLTPEYSQLHAFLSTNAIWINALMFVLMTIEWAVFCNTSFSGGATPCNDYAWCCVYWPSEWCQNNAPCSPVVTLLARNKEMLQHWSFCLVFALFAVWHRQMNGYLTRYGVLH